MYNDEIVLITKSKVQDEIGQFENIITSKTSVLCNIKDVSFNEFYQAQQAKLNIHFKIIMQAIEYEGQEQFLLDGVEYNIIRTYQDDDYSNYKKLDFDEIELTAVKAVQDGTQNT